MNNHFERTNSKGANLSRFCTIQKEKEPLGDPQFFKPTPNPRTLAAQRKPSAATTSCKNAFLLGGNFFEKFAPNCFKQKLFV
jgi:hypothetical protein